MDLYNNKNFVPMLLSETRKPFDDPNYLFELKLDGVRALVYVEPGRVLIKNRRGNILNETYPELLELSKRFKKKVIFDGEIIIMDNNKPSFEKLQLRGLLKNKERINQYALKMPVTFVAFDILYENKDLTGLALTERKEILDKYPNNNIFVKSKYILEKGKDLFKMTEKEGLEGIVAKKKDSPYIINIRSKDWLKIKNFQKENFYICGYLEKKDNASLLLCEKTKSDYFYVGKVSIRLNNPEYKRIKAAPKTKLPTIKKEGFIYLKPKLKCQVEYLERTKNKQLRQPIYRGII